MLQEQADGQHGTWPCHTFGTLMHTEGLQTFRQSSESESTRASSATEQSPSNRFQYHAPLPIALSKLLLDQPTQQESYLGSSSGGEDCPDHVVWSDPSSDESSLESTSSSDSDESSEPESGPPIFISRQHSKATYFTGKTQGLPSRQLSLSLSRGGPPDERTPLRVEADTVRQASLCTVGATQPSQTAGYKFQSVGHMLAWASLAHMLVGSSYLGADIIQWPVHSRAA